MEPSQREIKNAAKDVGQYAAEKTKQAGSSLERAGSNLQDQLSGIDLSETYQAVQERASDAMEATVDFVKEHPFYSLMGAAAIGFVAGSLLRRQ